MSDPTDNDQRTPRSSNSSNPSGTQALSVTIEPERAPHGDASAPETADPAPETADEPEASPLEDGATGFTPEEARAPAQTAALAPDPIPAEAAPAPEGAAAPSISDYEDEGAVAEEEPSGDEAAAAELAPVTAPPEDELVAAEAQTGEPDAVDISAFADETSSGEAETVAEDAASGGAQADSPAFTDDAAPETSSAFSDDEPEPDAPASEPELAAFQPAADRSDAEPFVGQPEEADGSQLADEPIKDASPPIQAVQHQAEEAIQLAAETAESMLEDAGDIASQSTQTALHLAQTAGATVADAANSAAETAVEAGAAFADRGSYSAEELRAAIRGSIARNETQQHGALQMFEEVSHQFASALDEARHDAARITMKLMEFAQANIENNLELARDYAAAKSVPEFFDVQAAYLRRQFELLHNQAAQLREITAEMTSKGAANIRQQAAKIEEKLDTR